MIFYDYTCTFQSNINTGIQRVVKQLGYVLAAEISENFTPVVLWGRAFRNCHLGAGEEHTRLNYSFRPFLRKLDSFSSGAMNRLSKSNRLLHRMKTVLWEFQGTKILGNSARMRKDDWYLTADSVWEKPEILEKLRTMRSNGVRTAIVHYDLIPITHPEWCCPNFTEAFAHYAEALPSFDVVLCISNFVKNEFLTYCQHRNYRIPKTVVTIPLGWEIDQKKTLPQTRCQEVLGTHFILCVGSVDPRKNHQNLLDAFDILWEKGVDMSLVVVGKPGYASHQIVSRLRNHKLSGRRLFYLPNCGDEELEELYSRCTFTILPSFFEGFGLPVVESLARGKPCLCSDIPVFRDIAGRFGVYISPENPYSIATGIEDLYSDPQRLGSLMAAIRSEYSPPSWRDCARVVLEALGYHTSPAEVPTVAKNAEPRSRGWGDGSSRDEA